MLRSLLINAGDSAFLQRQVTRRSLARNVALRFVAGESLDETMAVTGRLVGDGKSVTLDYLGESVGDESQARAAAKMYLRVLDRVGSDGLPCGVSVKPTQMGLDISRDLCVELLGEVIDAAAAVDAHVTLDMEASDVTEATVGLVETFQAEGRSNVGCALQAYLRRNQADVERLTAAGASLRLCKGAYAEPAEVAFQSRREVDASYAASAEWLLRHGRYPRLATHDHRLIERAKIAAARFERPRDDFEFQMLYGVRPRLQDALVADGYRLRIYVPFGGQWYPYLMRRLAERPANVAFFLRALRGT